MNRAMKQIRILEGDLHLIDLKTRMPFRYGIATMTHTPHAFVRLRVEVGDRTAAGIAADHLPPRWFEKDPSRSPAEEVERMLGSIEHALVAARGLSGPSAFEVWRQIHQEQLGWGERAGLPQLLSGFGTSLVERALIEAVCRALSMPFAKLVREDALGLRLGDLDSALRGLAPAFLLPAEPLARITVRHTVGLSDPLTDGEVPEAERIDDGLPRSLEAGIRAYGLRHFKVKVQGDLEADAERLERVRAVLQAGAPRSHAFSLDGNEQFKTFGDFRSWWEAISGRAALRGFFDRLLFVEQPLHRQVALEPEVGEGIRRWTAAPPLIIDESDATLESLPRALELGYSGTSHKNCKGVFKSIRNACLIEKLRRGDPSGMYLLSGEDLANIGPVALLQDLAACASLGAASVERNGHHYFAGLSMFDRAVQEEVLRAHPDLYRKSRQGWPTLRIEGGELELGSVLAAPFGVGFELDAERFQPVEKWRAARAKEEKR
jgi:hypothetical protein